MPAFDLITAISTGALQSPFVLLGTAASIDTLTSLYRNAADRIAPSEVPTRGDSGPKPVEFDYMSGRD